MLVYILKSAACLAILFVFYKLFLEKESIHKFKRFYLLGALVFSLIVPALVFTEYVEVVPPTEVTYAVTQPVQVSEEVINVPPALEADAIDIAPILWGLYFVGLFFFGLKFIRNLFQIFRRIRRNPKYKLNRFTQVLLQEKITPHTFFSYIFLNKAKFESNKIPEEVLLHEETHAQQKHSWDVLFVELLQVIFWVNPFIYLAKKAIKLNHEFLADQAVLQTHVDETTYKNTLLSYLSPDSEKKYQPLANAINYSSIKKRFTIMKTHTSKKAILLRSLLLLPLLAILLYGFSETKVETISIDLVNIESIIQEDLAQQMLKSDSNQPTELQLTNWKDESKFSIWIDEKHVPNTILNKRRPSDFGYFSISLVYKNARSEKFPQEYQVSLYTQEVYKDYIKRDLEVLEIFINLNGKILIKNQLVPLEKLNDFFEKSINYEKLLQVNINPEEGAPEGLPFKIANLVRKYDIPQIKISESNSKILINSSGPSLEEIFKYNKLAKSRNLFSDHGIRPRESEIREVERIYKGMSEKQKRNAEIFPDYPAKKSQDENASRKQITEYNTLAKKYNAMLSKSKSIQIKKKDVDRLEYIYGLMSNKQKADAEPFPNFPEPPPAPKEPKAPRVKKGDKSIIPPPPKASNLNDVEFADKVINETIANQDPYDTGNQLSVFKNDDGTFTASPIPPRAFKAKKGEKSNIPRQPAPNHEEREEIMELQEELEIREQEVLLQKEEAKLVEQEILMVEEEAKLAQQEILMEQQEAKLQEIEEKIQRIKYIQGEVDTDILEPQVPPAPKSPLDHVIEMAKKDAKFYLEGKEISSDKAIELIKTSKNMNIDSRHTNSKKPIVKMSTQPIRIDR